MGVNGGMPPYISRNNHYQLEVDVANVSYVACLLRSSEGGGREASVLQASSSRFTFKFNELLLSSRLPSGLPEVANLNLNSLISRLARAPPPPPVHFTER